MIKRIKLCENFISVKIGHELLGWYIINKLKNGEKLNRETAKPELPQEIWD